MKKLKHIAAVDPAKRDSADRAMEDLFTQLLAVNTPMKQDAAEDQRLSRL